MKKLVKPSHPPKYCHVVDKCCSHCYSVQHSFEGCLPLWSKDTILNPPPSSHIRNRQKYVLTTVDTNLKGDEKEETKSQFEKATFHFSYLNVMKLQLDLLKEKELK